MSFSRACRKSERWTQILLAASGSTETLLEALMSRLRAVDCAARTKPSISAPLKFFVSCASSWWWTGRLWSGGVILEALMSEVSA